MNIDYTQGSSFVQFLNTFFDGQLIAIRNIYP